MIRGLEKKEKKRISYIVLSQNKEEILVTIIALVCVTGHMVVAGLYNYLFPLPIPFSLRSQLVMVPSLVG